VILVIRFIGVLNAAIWLGASVFFLYAAGGTFFSPDVKLMGLHPFWPGVFAQRLIEKLFLLHISCSLIALVHMLAEWVYLGRILHRLVLGLLGGLFLTGLVSELVMLPKMKELHHRYYSMNADYKAVRIPDAERIEAKESFNRWHGAAMGGNLVVLCVLVFYFWRVTYPPDNLRFVGATKFRS
jgi:Domain of unknown function (DUF4149)